MTTYFKVSFKASSRYSSNDSKRQTRVVSMLYLQLPVISTVQAVCSLHHKGASDSENPFLI